MEDQKGLQDDGQKGGKREYASEMRKRFGYEETPYLSITECRAVDMAGIMGHFVLFMARLFS